MTADQIRDNVRPVQPQGGPAPERNPLSDSRPASVSADLYRIGFQTAPSAMCLANAGSRVLAVNDEFERLTGCSDAAAAGTLLSDFFVTESGEPADCARLLRGRQELRLRGDRQELCWVAVTGLPLRDGVDSSVLLTVEDISTYKHAAEALRDWRRIAEMAPIAIWIGRSGGRHDVVNRQWSDWTGLTPDESAGRGWLRAIHPDDRARVERAARMPISERPRQLEYRIVRTDGSVRWLLEIMRPDCAAGDEHDTVFGCCMDITERKLQEREIARLTRAVEQSPVMVMMTDAEGNIEYVNQRFTEVTGYTAAEVVGSNPRILKSGHTTAAEYAEFWNALRVNGEWRGELKNRKKNGDFYWESTSVSAIRDSGGAIINYVALKSDITERKLLDERLRLSEERFRIAAYAANDLVIEIDTHTEIGRFFVSSADQHEKWGGIPEALADWHRVIHPDDVARVIDGYMHSVASGVPVRVDCRVLLGGQTLDVVLRGSPVMDAGGACSKWIGVLRDVTESKRLELALRESEERFRMVFEHSAIGICIAECKDLRPVRANRAMCEIVGYTEEEYSALGPMDYTHPEDWKRQAELMAEVEAGRLPAVRIEKRYLRKDGAVVWAKLIASLVRDAAGQPLYWIAISENINDRKRAEATLAHLAAIVQASDDAIIAMDLDGVVTAWNHGAEQMHGYTAHEAIGCHFSFVVPQRDRKTTARLHEQVKAGVSVKNFETNRRRKDGRTVPVLLTLSPIRDSRGHVSAISAIAHDVSHQKRTELLLAHHANHDMLTGLANRRLFEERLQDAIDRASRRNRITALIYVDLDGFKLINDTLGHAAGDEALKMVAARLSSAIRRSDTLARTGGDEFSVVLDEIDGAEQAQVVANKLLGSLRRPFLIASRELFVTASVGISLCPWHGHNAGTLQQTADAAMYEAKRTGKNRSCLFASQIGDRVLERLETENDLRRALDRGELSLHYQPQFRVTDLTVSGAEALMRWNHPTRGPIPPSVFIPVAEETGLIVPIGNWALVQACETARHWGACGAPGRISVNASALQFGMPDFVDNVLETLSLASLDARTIEIELTESAVMRNFSEAAAKMQQLRDAGVSIALDDFGTGYSSLSCLQKMPIDALKLDKSFLQDVAFSHTAVALIKGVISLAHSLNLRVIAEGIESEAQLQAVREMGCDEAQGFLLGGVEASWQNACSPGKTNVDQP